MLYISKFLLNSFLILCVSNIWCCSCTRSLHFPLYVFTCFFLGWKEPLFTSVFVKGGGFLWAILSVVSLYPGLWHHLCSSLRSCSGRVEPLVDFFPPSHCLPPLSLCPLSPTPVTPSYPSFCSLPSILKLHLCLLWPCASSSVSYWGQSFSSRAGQVFILSTGFVSVVQHVHPLLWRGQFLFPIISHGPSLVSPMNFLGWLLGHAFPLYQHL